MSPHRNPSSPLRGLAVAALALVSTEAGAAPRGLDDPTADRPAREPEAQEARKQGGEQGSGRSAKKRMPPSGKSPAPSDAPAPNAPVPNAPNPQSPPSPGGSPGGGHAPDAPHAGPGATPHTASSPGSAPSGATPAQPRNTPADARAVPGARPQGYTRSYESHTRTPPPLSSRDDHRYTRPAPHHVRPAPSAGHPPPGHTWYRPYYTRWYVHPYYRWVVATYVVVSFGFEVHPWVVTWAPPPRAGWTWVPGYWAPGGWWVPGHWMPVGPAPVYYPGVTYVYVPGWWQGAIYVDGYWRAEARSGWTWVEGYYLTDGTYIPGHWEPTTAGPAGYVWEPGFFDGEAWHEGFWRPEFRANYTWVSAWFDEDGIYHAGFWKPTEERPGQVWIPGWFDGTQWVEGYWVTQQEYEAADPQTWTPPEGWDDGRGEQAAAPAAEAAPEEAPLAIPVSGDETTK